MIETVKDYCEDNEQALRAQFEAAMIKRIDEKGYKMSDLMFEVFCCQQAIWNIQDRLDELESKKKKS